MVTEDLPTRVNNTVEIRPLEPAELLECPALSSRRFGFSERNQIPAWVMQTMAWAGGFALGAFHGGQVVGYSIAFPGLRDGRLFLMSCGLAVEEEYESQSVGMALKMAQRGAALNGGYEVINWTTMSLNSRPLYVYLNKLGARLVRIHPDMYVTTLGMPYPDEVELEWRLSDFPPVPRRVGGAELVTRAEEIAGVGWAVVGTDLGLDADGQDRAYLVEIPWDGGEVLQADAAASSGWSTLVRATMRRLLEAGYVGTAVKLDRQACRSFVQFEHADALS